LPPSAVVDNDVLIKGACYSVLAELLLAFGGRGSLGVLGAARYVVADRLSRDERVLHRDQAIVRWEEFLGLAEELEPSPEALDLATTFEEVALSVGVALDVGESLLCAVAIVRPVPSVITGDKRAIEAMEILVPTVNQLETLAGRVVCLEQLIEALVRRLGVDATRLAICRQPKADRALSICFQCGLGADGQLDPDGLRSYIADLRGRAPTMLAGGVPF